MRETIAALCTAPGESGIAIVRISGENAGDLLRAIFRPYQKDCPFENRKLYLGQVWDETGEVDECMAVLMRAPHSYTRENVAELQLHGGAWAANRVLNALFAMGVRPARPGEFTLRAFLNGRVDLSRAEAVMRLIHASGEAAARSALRQLSGGASAFVQQAQDRLIEMLAALEAAIDYPEEVEEQQTAEELAQNALCLADDLESACDEKAARLMDEGLQVALCGLPNAGKSTLLNCLTGEELAIVTPIPGTTRDVVRGEMQLDGVRVRLSDTAGMRQTGDMVEQIGVDRAKKEAQNADVLLLLIDCTAAESKENAALMESLAPMQPVICYTKGDLRPDFVPPVPESLVIHAQTKKGIQPLMDFLKTKVQCAAESPLTMQRHITLAKTAARALRSAAEAFRQALPLELGAVDLHEALSALSAITGAQADEKILDTIFSSFCVGK